MIVYRMAAQWAGSLEQVEEALQKTPFMPCGATQEKSAGWVPRVVRRMACWPKAWVASGSCVLCRSPKCCPPACSIAKCREKADAIEKEFGRKPGKKEKRDLKDEAKLDLLPMAFTKQSSMWVWIDPQAKLLVLDTGAQGKADEVVTLLVEGLQGLWCGAAGHPNQRPGCHGTLVADAGAPQVFALTVNANSRPPTNPRPWCVTRATRWTLTRSSST